MVVSRTFLMLGLASAACLSSRAAEPAAYVGRVKSAMLAPLTTEDPDVQRCAVVLLNCARYNVRWISDTFDMDEARGFYKLTGMKEHGVRPACSASYGLATLLKTGMLDERAVGIERQEALARTLKLIKGIAATHKIQRHDGWGDQWQSALWAALMGMGAWLLWDDFDDEARALVAAVVAHEADRFIGYETPYWNGKGGDSKAGENSWNTMIDNVAVAMMPGHPHARRWKEIASELMVSAYATKADLEENDTVLDGRQVKMWLNGYNAQPGGVVVNHGIIHPDYMVAETMSLWAHITQTLAGTAIPETADFNGALVYKTLVTRAWKSPPYEEPGGTIYRPGVAAVYYPMGVDWSTHDVSLYYLIDAWAHVLGWDADLPYRAASWLRPRADEMLRMQRRHDDRRMFAPGEYDTYPGSEQLVMWCVTDAFWALWLDAHGADWKTANWLAAK